MGRATNRQRSITNAAEFAEFTERFGRMGGKITPDSQPPRPGDIRDSMADISMAVRDLGYYLKIKLEAGLRRLIEY